MQGQGDPAPGDGRAHRVTGWDVGGGDMEQEVHRQRVTLHVLCPSSIRHGGTKSGWRVSPRR